ncbi:MAG: hypothetical protein KBF92_00935 [Bacteroidia bacterium]|jgi:hypothetical protein|nr:hypothetical protein [Candidatus Brachybacter algidus]MBK8747313.1 hypothetical protein [Candidatus Brachybacter algidus]MBK9023820.1 hypothetical protein [Candidatus Brachybacter algidus]MBP9922365.1 hypothetical protein [Bacteroidia bacterium]
MKNLTEQEILRILARSWNTLSIPILEEVLHTNIIYQSQWVSTPIIGKKELILHLDSKYREIQRDRFRSNMYVVAEMAYFPKLNNKPCLIITQKTGSITRQVSVLISIDNGLIKRINVCYDPHPMLAIFTGEIPK